MSSLKEAMENGTAVMVSVQDMFRLFGFTEEMIADIEATSNERPPKKLYIAELTTGLIKIGIAADPEKRLRTICRQSGGGIKRQAVYAPDKPFKIEGLLHRRFAEQRTQGEFFKCDYVEATRAAMEIINSAVN